VGTYSGGALQRRAEPSDLLRAGLEIDPTGLALVSARTRLSWQALDDMASRVAVGYLELGLVPGDRIAAFGGDGRVSAASLDWLLMPIPPGGPGGGATGGAAAGAGGSPAGGSPAKGKGKP